MQRGKPIFPRPADNKFPALIFSEKFFQKPIDKIPLYWYNTEAVWCSANIWGYSSAGRALEWHSRGQRFDPAYLHQIRCATSGEKSWNRKISGLFLCFSPVNVVILYPAAKPGFLRNCNHPIYYPNYDDFIRSKWWCSVFSQANASLNFSIAACRIESCTCR